MLRRKSRQREQIYNLLSETDLHPTAQWAYDRMRKKYPRISLGNVYRNLNILVEEGRVRKQDYGDGVEHYDTVIEHHYHFVCEKCGKISDLDIPVKAIIDQIAKQNSNLVITGHTVTFYGICSICKRGS